MAKYYDCDEERILTLEAALASGQVVQLPDGRAAVVQGLNAAALAAGMSAAFRADGVYRVAKTTGIVILDGGPVYFDHSAQAAHYKKVNDRDFFLGSAVGDTASGDSELLVNLNVQPVYLVDVARDPIDSVAVANGSLQRLGGAQALKFTTAAEAQKIDILSKDGFSIAANPIVEFAVEVATNGDASAVDFNIGLASGTHATDADSIAQYLFLHIDGGSLNLNLQSTDGTTTVASTDTTIDAVLGTRFEVCLDCRDPADVQCYINGVLVLGGSTFSLALASTLYLLAHAEKTSDDSPGEYHIDWLRARTAQQ